MLSAKYKKKEKKAPSWLAEGYFPVHNSIMKQVGTNHYSKYLKVLELAGIIERRLNSVGGKNYLPGVHSQLFRFKNQADAFGPLTFGFDKVRDYRCIKSVLITCDRYALGEYKNDRAKNLEPIHEKLKAFSIQGKIDVKIAKGIARDKVLDQDNGLYLDYLEAINAKEISWFSVDEFGERVHHPLVIVKSEYRPAIRFKGYENETLAHIDIKNSQPYFSAIIPTDGVIDKFLPEFSALKPLAEKLAGQADYQKYLSLCISSGIYEHIGLLMGKSPEEIRQQRKVIKQQFFRAVLFPKHQVYGEDKIMQDAFKKEFPSVHSFYSAIKRMKETQFPALMELIQYRRTKSSDSKIFDKLSCAAQRLEARFVTQHIAGRLIEAGIGPFITIHDSFLVLPMHKDATVKIIEDFFKSNHIPPPRLNIEMLSANKQTTL